MEDVMPQKFEMLSLMHKFFPIGDTPNGFVIGSGPGFDNMPQENVKTWLTMQFNKANGNNNGRLFYFVNPRRRTRYFTPS